MTAVLGGYRRALRLYPRQFRQEYGEDMVALLAQQLRDEGAARVWTRTGLDLLRTIPLRHLETHMNVTARTVPTLAGVIFVTAGMTALVGGPIGIAAAVALSALAIGLLSWKAERPARALPPGTGRRALLLIAGGSAVLGLMAFAPTDGPDGTWYVFMTVLLGAIAAIVLGVLYGAAHLMTRHRA
jgi:hypothetical protein